MKKTKAEQKAEQLEQVRIKNAQIYRAKRLINIMAESFTVDEMLTIWLDAMEDASDYIFSSDNIDFCIEVAKSTNILIDGRNLDIETDRELDEFCASKGLKIL